MEELGNLYREILPQKLALVCLTKDEKGKEIIAGMNCLVLNTDKEKDLEVFFWL